MTSSTSATFTSALLVTRASAASFNGCKELYVSVVTMRVTPNKSWTCSVGLHLSVQEISHTDPWFLLSATWMFAGNFTASHLTFVEIFQSWPKCCRIVFILTHFTIKQSLIFLPFSTSLLWAHMMPWESMWREVCASFWKFWTCKKRRKSGDYDIVTYDVWRLNLNVKTTLVDLQI